MKSILLALASLVLSLPAHARYQVSSEFQLQLPEPLFDQMLTGLQGQLPKQQSGQLAQTTLSFAGIQVQLKGIRTQLQYDFVPPQRLSSQPREWLLSTKTLGGKISVDQLLIGFRQQRESNGTVIDVDAIVECRNIVLALPASAGAGMSARVRAEITNGRMNFSLAEYKSKWPTGAWKLESLQCSQLENIQATIQAQIMENIGKLANVDQEVSSSLSGLLRDWSQHANKLLLSTQEIPSGKKHLKIFQEVRELRDHNGQGLSLNGVIRFDYPFVTKNLNQELKLPAGTNSVSQAQPQLLIPFGTVRALLAGEFYAGQLTSTMRTSQMAGFGKLLGSRKRQLFAWPSLMSYPKNTNFLFQFGPLAAPDCRNESFDGKGGIRCGLDLPLEARMRAPIDGKWTPYVKFRTRVQGQSNLKLLRNGKIKIRLNTTEQPISYAFDRNYVELYHPSKRIAVNTIGKSVWESLNSEGMEITLPALLISKDWQLLPLGWNLQAPGVLKVDFTVQPKAAKK